MNGATRKRRLLIMALLLGGLTGILFAERITVHFVGMPPEALLLTGDGYSTPTRTPETSVVTVEAYGESETMLELRLPRPPVPAPSYYSLVVRDPISFDSISTVRAVQLTVYGRSERVGVGVVFRDGSGIITELFMGYLGFSGTRMMYFSADQTLRRPTLEAIHFYLPQDGLPRHDTTLIGLMQLEVIGE